MVISIWPSRPTMRERAPSIRRTEFPAFERRATTYKKFRMRITGQVRGDFRQALRCALDLSARTKILPAESSSPTTDPSRATESSPIQSSFAPRRFARIADVCAGAAGKDNAETRRVRRFAETWNSVRATCPTLFLRRTTFPYSRPRYSTRSAGSRALRSWNNCAIAEQRDLVLVPGVYSFRAIGARF